MSGTQAAAPAASGERLVAIVVHDVAPATWAQCRALLEMIDSLGNPPVTLLVVPHFHRGLAARESQVFIEAMNLRASRGDELALHGFHHTDDAPLPRSPGGWIKRRMLTRGEAEFAAICADAAADRLQRGIALFNEQRWPLHGFVPPAWQLNAATRRAIDASSHRFDYVPIRRGIYRLPDWQLEPTANFCYSPDRGWRRAMSRAQIGVEAIHHGGRRVLRLSLHPLDAGFPSVVAHWQSLIASALRERRAATKFQAVGPAGLSQARGGPSSRHAGRSGREVERHVIHRQTP